MITGAAAAPIGRNLQSGGVVAGAFPPMPGFGPKPYDHPRRGTGLVAHPVFKTGRAGQPPAWKVRFLRRVVAAADCGSAVDGSSVLLPRVVPAAHGCAPSHQRANQAAANLMHALDAIAEAAQSAVSVRCLAHPGSCCDDLGRTWRLDGS